jgi:DNA polymerase elongation subunit (family B)
MKYYFIKAEYKVENQETMIYLWGREIETLDKRMFKILGFKPRFYVLESEPVMKTSAIREVKSGFKSILGEPCKMIVVNIPSEVKELRKFFTKTFQADIPFTRVFLIELEIRTWFDVPDKTELNYTELTGG